MTQHRAVELLHQAGRAYPHAWALYAQYQKGRAEYRSLPAVHQTDGRFKMDWPDWCWCPIAAAHAVVTSQVEDLAGKPLGPGPIPEHLLAPRIGTGALAALAAWRTTQGIYRIDPELYKELIETPVTGDIPVEVLRRLPEWSVYIETPGFKLSDPRLKQSMRVEGFFAFLEYDMNTGREELRFALDTAGPPDHAGLVPMMVHLGGTLGAGIKRATDQMMHQVELYTTATRGAPTAAQLNAMAMYDVLGKQLHGLVSLVLYLCADEAEVPRPSSVPPHFVATKKGKAIVPTGKPTVHECGTRLGAQLRLARIKMSNEAIAESIAKGGRVVEPHIRRAHWHTFLTGPRDHTRVPKVKWLPPIPVLLDDVPRVATVRPVRKEDER